MPVTGTEALPDRQTTLLTSGQERTGQRQTYRWRLLVSDDRFTRRRRLPRLASPVSTNEVETSHPPVMTTAQSYRTAPAPTQRSAAATGGRSAHALGAPTQRTV